MTKFLFAVLALVLPIMALAPSPVMAATHKKPHHSIRHHVRKVSTHHTVTHHRPKPHHIAAH